MVFTVTGKSFANECCRVPMPTQISPGVFFVADATILAMGGDPTKLITWTGDQNYWGEDSTENYVHNGTPGIKVSGTGHPFKRWNLRQEGHPNRGWLTIEDAFDMYTCPNFSKPGKKTPGDDPYDWKGKGPAFWYVQPDITINIKKD